MRSKILRGLLLVLGVVIVSYVIGVVIAKPAEPRPFFTQYQKRPMVIAHQGGDGIRPSETMMAYENAAALKVDVLEMDIHATSDGVIVLMHDAKVDRTTDGTGEIKKMTVAQIKELDAAYWWSPGVDTKRNQPGPYPYRGQGAKVLTLKEMFQKFPAYRMNIEIKQVEPSMGSAFCNLIRDHNMSDKVLVASFHQQAMDDFRRACPDVATSATQNETTIFFAVNTLFLTPAYTPPTQSLQVPEYSSGLHVLTQGFVDGARSRKMETHAWTINKEEDMKRILSLGVDGIITDYPDVLLKLLGR
jgi:glycerophosphoryl diester phosphodiesterase